MGQETTDPAVSAVLSAAADSVERDEMRRYARDIGQRGAGGEIYTLLFQAAERLYGWPAVQHLQTHLGSQLAHGHLQHWRETDPADVVKALREAAAVTPKPDVEVAAMREQVELWWAEVCKAMPWLATQPQFSRADELVREVARLQQDHDKLVAENDRLRAELAVNEGSEDDRLAIAEIDRDHWRQQYEEQLANTRTLDDMRCREIGDLNRELKALHELAEDLVSIDGADIQQRRTIRLDDIIQRAREALGNEERP